MTIAAFRRMALALEGAVEGAHMGHPDFRVNGRIFATLWPADDRGMVKVAPADQQRFVADHPESFLPENGAWGREGCTRVLLAHADEETVGEALTLAWRAAVAKGPSGKAKTRPKPASGRKAAAKARPTLVEGKGRPKPPASSRKRR